MSSRKSSSPRAKRAGVTRTSAGGSAPQSAEWWSSYFDQQYLLEYEPIFTLEKDRHEAARLIELLGLPVGARILDVPCGQGRHAHLLAESGFEVDGLDYSAHLLKKAKARGTSKTLRYTQGDMRALPTRWTERFDAVVNLFTSFGFFTDPNDDLRVVREFARVLKPGGVLVWHGGSRDGVMARFLERDWWTTDDGTMVAHERSFDPLSGLISIRSTFRGPNVDGNREYQIRLYTATRLSEICAEAGLVVEQAFEGFTHRPLRRRSSEMLLIARRE